MDGSNILDIILLTIMSVYFLGMLPLSELF